MKILIAYYSKFGKTEKLAELIKEKLEEKGHSVDFEKIKPKKEHGVLGWFLMRLFKNRCEIEDIKIKDLSFYDAICMGSPNWAGISLPVAEYIRTIKGLRHKRWVFLRRPIFP
jgi:multimeric flavodoxin WrbA